jgi:hypothetical protein
LVKTLRRKGHVLLYRIKRYFHKKAFFFKKLIALGNVENASSRAKQPAGNALTPRFADSPYNRYNSGIETMLAEMPVFARQWASKGRSRCSCSNLRDPKNGKLNQLIVAGR